MKLEWLAAVLRPNDIAPHLNFGNSKYDRQPHVRLAAAILGQATPYRPRIGEEEIPEKYNIAEDTSAKLSIETFFSSTQRSAVTDLVEQLSRDKLDIAIVCSLALVAAVAFGELEERESVEQLLESTLRRVAPIDASHTLLRACLLQQLSLRKRDWGSNDTSLSEEANSLLAGIEKATFPEFPISQGATGSSRDTITNICEALQYSIWSSLPNTFSLDQTASSAPIEWQKIVNSKRSEEFLLIHREEASVYQNFIINEFRSVFGDRSIRFGGGTSDLFYANLRNELYGSSAVYTSRRDLSVLRLVQGQSDSSNTDYAECLRMLRYSKSDDYLTLALDRIELGGPLAALSRDARQVIARRLTPGYVRDSDLAVLRAATDLLTDTECRDALSAVLGLIDAGSPTNEPGRWTAFSARLERTWLVAASLANVGDATEKTATRLLRDLKGSDYDETIDLAYARALDNLEVGSEWHKSVSAADWIEWVQTPGTWLHTVGVARFKLGIRTAPTDDAVRRLSDVIDITTDALSGHAVLDSKLSESADIVEVSLAGLQQSTRGGRFPGGGTSPAVVAVDLIRLGVDRLWQPLVDFLLDDHMPRRYKSGAIDRLISAKVEIPATYQDNFKIGSEALLFSQDAMPVDRDPVVPYPAAVRLLGSFSLVDDAALVRLLTTLAGKDSVRARIEAAKSVSILSARRQELWLATIALQLSYQSNAQIQGYAANALALLSDAESIASEACVLRLIDLMEGDGLIAPLLAIRGLNQRLSIGDRRIRLTVEGLRTGHPSRRVRAEATTLLSSERETDG